MSICIFFHATSAGTITQPAKVEKPQSQPAIARAVADCIHEPADAVGHFILSFSEP